MTTAISKKRVISISLAFIVAIAIIMLPQIQKVYAEAMPVKYAKTITVYGGAGHQYELKMGKKGTVKKIKSNKTSVVSSIKKVPGSFLAKKPGKAKLTIKMKNGKTYKCTVRVIKYQNPFKKFLFGGKNVVKLYNDEGGCDEISYDKDKATIKITPAKNWKVKKITHWSWDREKDTEVKSIVKNGTTVKLNDVDSSFEILMYNKKYNFEHTYYLYQLYL